MGTGRGRGRETWAKGKKLDLLESYKTLFFKDKSAMYAQATSAFINKWGYDLAPNNLPDPNKIYTVLDINTFGDGKQRTDEETRQSDFHHKLHEKIANWAHHRWH
ncbi:hypothetical protein E1B28_009500 [Marasmius oreades]|uniref:Uncharacterized protein n=1 Tax=Marasmius oreades TaxID=181124 RepID=A0A9P7RWB5_9AGAR|nr:uncharacterized protein E1B28_009500 [Marasmius oreades]KAG7090381.1 hypothetical protein E1B28_009500 [Marasmius oreades]